MQLGTSLCYCPKLTNNPEYAILTYFPTSDTMYDTVLLFGRWIMHLRGPGT